MPLRRLADRATTASNRLTRWAATLARRIIRRSVVEPGGVEPTQARARRHRVAAADAPAELAAGSRKTFGLRPLDEVLVPFTRWVRSAALLAAVALLQAAGVLAGYLPARRASRLEPLTTLREE